MTQDATPPATPDHDVDSAAMQRRAAFEAEFGSGGKVAHDLRMCLLEARMSLSALAGAEAADRAFDALLARVFRAYTPHGMWPRTLRANEAELCTTMGAGRAFRELAAYARYGIALNGGVTERERFDLLNTAFQRALLVQIFPTSNFKGSELDKILLEAEARLRLDEGAPLDLRELSALGGVDERVVRDRIVDGALTCDRGRVPAAEALGWLRAEAHGFRDSIWRTQEPFRDLQGRQALAA